MSNAFLESISPTRVSEVIGTIYESSMETPQWQGFLDELITFYPGIACAIAGFSTEIAVPIFTQSGFQTDYISRYATDASLINDTVRYMTGKPIGEVFGYTIVPEEEYWDRNLVKNWLIPQGFGPSSMAVLASSGEHFLAINVAYPHGSDVALRYEVEEALRVFVPHIIRAMDISRRATQNKIVSYSLKGLCDAISLPMLVTDQSGRLVFANTTGSRFLEKSADISIGNRGVLSIHNVTTTRKLLDRIDEVAKWGTTSGLTLNSRSDNLGICIIPLSSEGENNTSLDSQLFGVTRLAGLLICQRRAAALDPILLRDVFGLSNMEALICGMLMIGYSPNVIAEDQKRSVRTVRNHIQAIYAKIDVSSQNELADALGTFRIFGTLVPSAGNRA